MFPPCPTSIETLPATGTTWIFTVSVAWATAAWGSAARTTKAGIAIQPRMINSLFGKPNRWSDRASAANGEADECSADSEPDADDQGTADQGGERDRNHLHELISQPGEPRRARVANEEHDPSEHDADRNRSERPRMTGSEGACDERHERNDQPSGSPGAVGGSGGDDQRPE